jgi:UDP-glucuronate 4-epimerase
MAQYLVTGAAGFIGSKVAEQLLDRGDEVVGIDNMSDAYDVRLKDWRLARLQGRENFEYVKGDIVERADVDALFRGRSYAGILNLAARAGVRPSVENPWIYYEANQTGTLNLLQAAVEHGVEKFVLSSTSSLYGGENERPFSETANTDRPLSPYAASKKAAETLCYTYHYLHGIDVTVFRYFTVYGPAGRPDMSLFRFVQWISEDRPVRLFGDGSQERDFTYVDDVARGTIAGLKPLGYEVINLGSDEPVVLNDAIALVEERVGRKGTIERSERHPADVHSTWANIAKAEALLGWRPRTDFRTGVANLVAWYGENREWAREISTCG